MTENHRAIPKLVLIDGLPGNGKSYLAKNILSADYQYHVVGTDELYFDFIQKRHPELFFSALGHFIGPHYDAIVSPGSHGDCFRFDGKNVAASWAAHLCETVLHVIAGYPRVAVEGYLLKTLDRNRVRGNPAYALTEITVKERRYFLPDGSEVRPEDFAGVSDALR